MDHTFHRSRKRKNTIRPATRDGRTWFSRATIKHAKQFSDVPWFKLLVPGVLGASMIMAAQTTLEGDYAALTNVLGWVFVIWSVRCAALKITTQ